MKFLIVPRWLSQVLRDNDLSNTALLDASKIDMFLSKNDMNQYKSINTPTYPHSIRFLADAVKYMFKPNVGMFSDRSLVYDISHPRDGESAAEASLRHDEELLLGYTVPANHYLSFSVDLVDGDIIMVSAILCGGAYSDKLESNKKLYSEVLELLYASNSIGAIANTSLMREYIQRNI